MNKQIISTFIILLFLIPLVISMKKSLINDTAPITDIVGVISDMECKKINKRLNGEVYIYYNKNNDFVKFQDDFLKDYTFKSRCIELSKFLKIGKVFHGKIAGIFQELMGLKVDDYIILDFDKEVKEFNSMTKMAILLTLVIGILLIIGNIIIYYKKLNPDKLLESSWFQKVLYFVAIMGIIRFLLDYF